MLSRQFQGEEQKCLAEHMKQIENERSHKYQCSQRRDLIIPDLLLQKDTMMTRDQKGIIVKKDLKYDFHMILPRTSKLKHWQSSRLLLNTHNTVAFKDPQLIKF